MEGGSSRHSQSRRHRGLDPLKDEPDDGRPASVKATWHWFALTGDEPRPIFSFAGLWQRWRGPVKKDGPNVESQLSTMETSDQQEAANLGLIKVKPEHAGQSAIVNGDPEPAALL